jgi:hypothetical protein
LGRFETIQFLKQVQYLNLYPIYLTGFEKWAGGKLNGPKDLKSQGAAQLALRAN